MKKFASPSFPSTSPEPMMEVNMTPLIDVMLVLIIMLIITIPKQNDVLQLDMPVASLNPAKPLIVMLDVAADGSVLWDGTLVVSRKELETRLAAMVRSDQAASLHVRPHRLADYKFVASVMSSARRMQVKHMGIVGNEQFI